MKIRSVAIRRTVAVILCAALVVPAVLSFPAESYAAVKSGDTEAVKSAAYNSMGQDIHYYSDGFFRGNSVPYNRSLAALSYLVCNMSYRYGRATSADQARNLREFLQDNGFSDFAVNEDYSKEAAYDSSAVACAHKSITDNGKTYTLLAVIPRSGTFGGEFARTLYLSKSANDIGDHAGYVACKDKMVDFVRDYIKKYRIKGNIKVWTTGYSGGGGISNLFAAEIIKYPATVLGNPNFKASDLYNYNFSPLRAASVESDPKSGKYNCIHNVLDDSDFLMILPTSDRFDRYGKDYKFRDYADKNKALELMKIDDMRTYEQYVNGQDPDLFMTYKPDVEEMLKTGKLAIVPDPDSYLLNDGRPDQAHYLAGVEEAMIRVCAQAGDGDSRKGFCRVYQQPMMDLIAFFTEGGNNIGEFITALTASKTSLPLMLSMYMTFMVSKNIDDKNFDSLVEDSFNSLASEIENEDGSLKPLYKGLVAYEYIKNNFFIPDNSGAEGKYKLKESFSDTEKSLLLQEMKKLTGALYSSTMKSALREAGVDKETIDRLTSEETSQATAFFLANILFGNGLQSSQFKPLRLDNEQFCQLATFVSNASRYGTLHFYNTVLSWFRAADPYYADFCKCTDAQNAGYRRVFVTQPAGTGVSGTVADSSGNTVASFRDGQILSRRDEWIGMTASDSGNWLRLPLDQSYRVELRVDRDADVSLRIADYSMADGAEVRTAKTRNWKVQGARPNDILTLVIPAVGKTGDRYDMAGAEYTLNVSQEQTPSGQNTGVYTVAGDDAVFSKSVPAQKGVSVKAGKKSITVKWKKLSAKQRKKFSKVQIQYSTDRQFSNAKNVYRGRNKTSCTLKKLQKGTYYVRVRSVKQSGAVRYVSKWSKTKKVKVR